MGVSWRLNHLLGFNSKAKAILVGLCLASRLFGGRKSDTESQYKFRLGKMGLFYDVLFNVSPTSQYLQGFPKTNSQNHNIYNASEHNIKA